MNNNSKRVVIIGGGSAAFAAALKCHELGSSITMINDGLPIGGTCVNVGCVPSKALLRAAESLHKGNEQRFEGIEKKAVLRSFSQVMNQTNKLVHTLREQKYLNVLQHWKHFELIEGHASFLDANHISIDNRMIEADRVIIATGARPAIPPIEGLKDIDYLTNQNLFQINELPTSLIVLGGNVLGLEMAQAFARLGSKVTVLEILPRILASEAPEISAFMTETLTSEGIEIHSEVNITSCHQTSESVVLSATTPTGTVQFKASRLLVAAGRKPNSDQLNLEAAGVTVDERGFIIVDDTLQTHSQSIYAVGDVIGNPMFVYTAAYEGTLAAENALSQSHSQRDYRALPWVMFTDPQLGGVGFDETQALAAGYDAQSTTLPLDAVPRAIAAFDTRGFITLIRDRRTDRLLGMRIVAPEGSELLMEAALLIKHQRTVEDILATHHPYLTLSEGIKLAAITFHKDVHKLSCCAS